MHIEYGEKHGNDKHQFGEDATWGEEEVSAFLK